MRPAPWTDRPWLCVLWRSPFHCCASCPTAPDLGGRGPVEPAMHEQPGRRVGLGQASTCTFLQPVPGEAPRRLGGQCLKTIGRACENRNGKQVKDLLPASPGGDLGEVVCPHEPDEARIAMAL